MIGKRFWQLKAAIWRKKIEKIYEDGLQELCDVSVGHENKVWRLKEHFEE